jgi:hypothetical protein
MMSETKQTIILHSFLQKSINAFALKSLIRSTGAELQRIRRSRHWKLKATPWQLTQIVQALNDQNQPSWSWLAKLLTEHVEVMSEQELIRIAQHYPNITVNQLVAKTGCTIAQARRVIDIVEWQLEEVPHE